MKGQKNTQKKQKQKKKLYIELILLSITGYDTKILILTAIVFDFLIICISIGP